MWNVPCLQGKEPTWHGRNLDALACLYVSFSRSHMTIIKLRLIRSSLPAP